MQKIKLFPLTLAIFLILAQHSISHAQDIGEWTTPKTHPCFQGISITVVNMGYSNNVGGYLWGIKFTNEKYQTPVSFKYKMTIGGKVTSKDGWLVTYPVVFGSNDMNDKYMEGDKRTPEGHFKVLLKKIHPQWGPELLLDFPNEESIRKFSERQAKGLIAKSARIGNGIAIHATRPQEEWTVDYYQNWTDGCISLKYSEAKDLYSYIPSGTPVTIQK